jgi:hypothetical protein
MASRWKQAQALFAGQGGGGVYVVLKVFQGYRTAPDQPDSWHQYGPAAAYDSQLPHSVSVSPGFWKVGESPRLARDPARFEADVRRMAASGAAWQLVTTWNEWGEGTSVEPADQFGTSYVDILCRNLPGPAACGETAAPAVPAAPAAASAPEPATSGSTPESVVIAAAGDVACGLESGQASCRQLETSEVLLKIDPAVVLALGDLQYERGAYADFLQSFDPSWGRLKERIRPVVGNHEYSTRGASGYFDYFDGVGALAGQAGDRDKGYYSYALGRWHLFAVNSNCARVGGCGPGSRQEQWLRAELAAHPTACSLMYMHHPFWSSDAREFSLGELRPLLQAFYDLGGDVVLAGHSHFYERYAPSAPDQSVDPARGFRQFIVGTGGRNVYGFGPIQRNSEVRNGSTFGVLRLTLNPTSYDWEFVPIAGQSFTDSGTQPCH